MKILMTSEFFYPHIGGIETVTEYLADEFVRMGHEVKIITTTVECGDKNFSFEVLRKPTKKAFWKAYSWCDVYVHQGVSLKRTWPLLLKHKPWFVVYHQVFYQSGLLGKMKKICSYFSHAIAVSETTRQGYGLKKADVILNSYDSERFRLLNESMRKDFVFVGKLTRTKGVHLLIQAFDKFKASTGSDWKLTLIGGGEEDIMNGYINASFYKSDIKMLGFKYPKEIVDILNQHQVQIVPSLAPEAFGVVVLEGMACGCLVIGSDGDGIKEAMGEAGFSFEKGNIESLAKAMEKAYKMNYVDYQNQKDLMHKRLEELSLRNVAERYIQLFERYTKKI